ncbi:MAG: hypothetical protein MUF34_18190 [Polyangiaceae bacterium]|nr:hypothetical protein [Polyangiaceae bacterium]
MKRAMVVGLVGVLLGGLAASGCVIREVRVGDDGDGDGGRGGAAGAVGPKDWACLEEEPLEPTKNVVSLQLEVIDASTNRPSTNAFVRTCAPFEADCEPLGAPVQVDVTGKATLQVPEDFTGFLQVYGPKGPDVDDPTFVRVMVYFPTREVLRGARDRRILVFSTAVMRSLAQLGGGTFEPDTSAPGDLPTADNGLVLLTTLDCDSKPAARISYELLGDSQRTEQTSRFYMLGSPGVNLPSTIPIETDASGGGGFTNVKAGLAVFSAKLNTLDRFVTKDTGTAAFVRPGWYTQVYISP